MACTGQSREQESYSRWSGHSSFSLPAAIGYYASVSVVPPVVVSAVVGETLVAVLDESLTLKAVELLKSTLVDARSQDGVTALGATLADRLRDRQLQQGGPPGSNQRATMGEQPAGENGDGESGDDGRERIPSGGGSEPDGDDHTPSASGDRPPSHRERYPGVQSLQLTRGDIPRFRGEQPNEVTEGDLEELRERIAEFETEIEDRTVHREELERELKSYVRSQTRRGRARGWGPYLVLLYGTAMTLGAFFFLGDLLAILAILVIWLSTLGLYALMVLVGVTSAALELPGRIGRALAGLRNLR